MERTMKTIRLPADILEQMRPLMIKNNLNFTNFVMEAIKNYICVLNYRDGVKTSFGAWKNSEHLELEEGVDNYIRKMREGRRF